MGVTTLSLNSLHLTLELCCSQKRLVIAQGASNSIRSCLQISTFAIIKKILGFQYPFYGSGTPSLVIIIPSGDLTSYIVDRPMTAPYQ